MTTIAAKRWSAPTRDDLDALLGSEGITHVHAGLFDIDGVFREKRLPAARVREYLARDWSFIDALPYWGPNDTTRADRAYRSEACRLDPASVRPYPFEPNAALVVADYVGASASVSPRALLARQIARARSLGFEPVGASEFEVIVLEETPATLAAKDYDGLVTAAQENRCWSGLYPASGAEFLRAWDACLLDADIPLHHLCPELGPGCIEAALPARALGDAADDAALFKLFTKAFCIRNGRTASFMAQLSDAHPGLGGHPIISLSDVANGAALFHRDGDDGVSDLCRRFVAGVLALMPELMVMCASTVNAYRRYVPGNWAPRTATWGMGNYTCAIRVVAGAPDDARIEFRLPGADMNPHLGFAMLLGAGLYGIEQRLEPPPETSAIGRELVHPDIGPLPRTLLEAAERFERSRHARSLFGAAFVEHFARSCIQEDHLVRRHVAAFERRRYLHHV